MENQQFETSPEEETESKAIANILRGFGEEHGFDTETCDDIAALPFPEAFEMAFSYLSQTGLDPEEVLAQFMELGEE